MTGKVLRVMSDKRFGFIHGEDNKDYFFHQSEFTGFFDDLVTDVNGGRVVTVQFEPSMGAKGPRASKVARLDGGVPQ